MRPEAPAPLEDRDGPVLSRRALLGSGAVLAATALAGPVAGAAAAPRPATRRPGGRRGIDEVAAHRIFAETAHEMRTPGSVMLLRTPTQDLFAAYGSGVLGATAPLSNFDRFRVGSVTKTMTGTVILQLVQRGRLSLQSTVSRFVPNVPNGREITIEQLLSMRSGLFNYTLSLPLNRTLDNHPQRSFTARELLAVSFAQRSAPPGGAFDYSNTNTILLGIIARQLLDGQSLPSIFRERLFAPLGMDNTVMPRSFPIPAPHPRGYQYGTNVSTLKTAKLPSRQLRRALSGALQPHDVTDTNPSWAGAAGAVISTAQDMATWAEGLVDGGLLSAKWQRRRLASARPVDASNPNRGYGLGIGRFGVLYGHGGEIPGFQSFVVRDPKRRLTIVVLSNLSASPRGEGPSATIAARLAKQIYG